MWSKEMPKHSFSFLLFFVLISHEVEAKTRFTKTPPTKLYVVKGQTARFVWDYHVDNKEKEFRDTSPKWLFYESPTLNEKGKVIGFDIRGKLWKFVINPASCPPRLLKPTVRVSRESNATLVITNVTTADKGEYGCVVVLNGGLPSLTNKSELVVTETPTFITTPNAITTVVEHTDLSIDCKAVGPPPPNVTWVNVTSKIKHSQGIGSAVLQILKIKRDQNGMVFKCLARNNPNQASNETVTTIVVNYAPEIKSTFVERAYCIEDTANITVSVDGNPKPTTSCKHGLKQVDPKGLKIEKDDQYGNYTCNVTNRVGFVTYVVKLIKTNTSCQPKPTPAPSANSVHPGIIAGVVLAAILAIVGVVIAIIFWRRRKTYKRDSTTSHNQTVHMNDLDDGEEQYATPQHANRVSAPKEEPTEQYAVVDKSKKKKKKQPGEGELIYADLDHEATPSDRPPSDRRPTGSSDQDTVYADINRAQEETPRYGNLQQMDHM